jgi:Zn-dependent protease with chaperone function
VLSPVNLYTSQEEQVRFDNRAWLAFLLSEALILIPAAGTPTTDEVAPSSAKSTDIGSYLRKSYAELFEIARERMFSVAEINQARIALKNGREKSGDSDRHNLHCNIQNLRAEKNSAELIAHKAIPIAYDNKEAKLELLEKWPDQYQQIRAQLADGSYRKRRWGDVQDIGFREIERGQEDDIKTGQKAVEQMKKLGMMPHEVDNQAIVGYVTELANRVAAHSDLHIPLHVTVLNSKEVNAFALPGGYLFIERGLLEAADDESELAGVIAHEIAHDVARHAHKLMKRATIADIFYQGAEVAALVLTGGAAGIGTIYALQYGFSGLGLVLDLKLLGVSREYELEADTLGIHYAWNTGYDPSGFVRFFDKMATREGYVNGIGWFHDHPPFYDRMVNAEREIMFLPKKPQLAVQTSAFEQMKKELAGVKQKAEQEAKDKPSLLMPEKGCPAPQMAEYKPGMQIDSICASPDRQAAPARPPKQKTKSGD